MARSPRHRSSRTRRARSRPSRRSGRKRSSRPKRLRGCNFRASTQKKQQVGIELNDKYEVPISVQSTNKTNDNGAYITVNPFKHVNIEYSQGDRVHMSQRFLKYLRQQPYMEGGYHYVENLPTGGVRVHLVNRVKAQVTRTGFEHIYSYRINEGPWIKEDIDKQYRKDRDDDMFYMRLFAKEELFTIITYAANDISNFDITHGYNDNWTRPVDTDDMYHITLPSAFVLALQSKE